MNTAVDQLHDQWPKSHRINVDEYYRMAEVGLLAPDARVELIEGEVIDMAPIGTRHAYVVDQLAAILMRAADRRALVRIQSPVRLSKRSEPQPDLSLLKLQPHRYRDAHPTPADVLLLIEVSDTTLKFDRGPKLAMYAKHGIPEVWVVDIENKQLHCMRDPVNEDHHSVVSLQAPQNVAVAAFPDIQIELAALFD